MNLLGEYLVIYILVRYCFTFLFHGYLWWLLANFIEANYTFYCSFCLLITSPIIARQNFLHISSFISLISFIFIQFSLHLPINSLLCWHFVILVSNIVKQPCIFQNGLQYCTSARDLFYIERVTDRVHYTYSHLEKILVGNSRLVIQACICLR